MTIPIFCINLERAKDRKDQIKSDWVTGLGLEINFWKAYDRRDIEKGKYVYSYNPNLTKKNFWRQLSIGEIACATSYCMLYEHLLKYNYLEAIIMEDDITPIVSSKKELFNIIEQGKLEFPESEIMLLHKPLDPLHAFKKIKTYHSLCKDTAWGNQLFYINKAGFLKVYNLLKTMSYPADYAQKLLCKQDIVIASNKYLCDHEWYGKDATTYIGNELRDTKRRFIK
jgi:GR25 family glycosyltransferase involved in LPS biosynthesis